ncbi:efflux RND transporter permease subunit [Wukongibacter sp. M2B1]|uniref:efflux RND transporter permease subunit n=1 Tax=Wukongibacter sp. M2B1 TaxID=3088895 RepID=UPI003D7B1C4D
MNKQNIFGRVASLMINRYRLVYLVIVTLIFWGALSHGKLPKEVLPEVKFPYVIIMTSYPGASTESVEREITNRVESAVSGIGDINKVTSDSMQGFSEVVIKFNQGVDAKDKLQKIQTEINNIKSEFPKKSEPSIIEEYDLNDFPIMLVNISGKYDLANLKKCALDIKNKIDKVSGVKKIKVIGGMDREIQIITKPDKLNFYKISSIDVKNAIAVNNVSTPLGEKVLNDENYSLKTDNKYESVQDIKRTIIGMRNDYPVFVKDIAQVKDTYKEKRSLAIKSENLHTEKESTQQVVYLAIYKKKNTDAVKINRMVKETIERGKRSLYPKGVNISYSSDMSKYITKSLDDVFGNAFTGLLCVIVVLFIFINFRESLIVAVVIPLSLLISVIAFKYLNISYNVLSTMGLIMALGMLVDNAIVVIESINMNRSKTSSIVEATKASINEIGPAICASTLTTIGAFLPLAMLSGEEGKVIKIIPVAAIVAMIASFAISIVITPTLSTRFLKMKEAKSSKMKKAFLIILIALLSLFAFSNNGKITILSYIGTTLFSVAAYIKLFKNKNSDSEGFIINKYRGFLSSMIRIKRKRIILLIVTTIVFVISIVPLVTDILPTEAMPITDNTTIYVELLLPKGSTLKDSKLLSNEMHKILSSYKEIKTYTTEIDEDQIYATVELVNKNKRDYHSKYMMNYLLNDLKKVPGIKVNVTNPDSEEEGAPISIEIRGDNLELLESYANRYKDILTDIKGVVNPRLSTENGLSQYVIKYNKQKAAILGLNPENMDAELWQGVNGEKVTTINQNNKEIDVTLKSIKGSFDAKNDLNKIQFTTSEGNRVPFRSVATVREMQGVGKIKHVDSKRTIKILAENDPNVTIKTILMEFRSQIENGDYRPSDDIEIYYTGYAEKMNESYSDMRNKMILAILVVYAILVAQFNSFSQPFVIMLSVPLAIIGVVWGHLLVGIKFSTLSFMGVISLVGIAVNDAIVLIDCINQLRKNEGMAFEEAIVEAGRSRFIPVIATSVTTIGGVLPLALYSEDYSQMAYTLIFGLITSTILILLIVPIVYFIVENIKIAFRKKSKRSLEMSYIYRTHL